MIHGGKDPGLAVLHREGPGAIGAPHPVRGQRDDRAVMGRGSLVFFVSVFNPDSNYWENLCNLHGERV